MEPSMAQPPSNLCRPAAQCFKASWACKATATTPLLSYTYHTYSRNKNFIMLKQLNCNGSIMVLPVRLSNTNTKILHHHQNRIIILFKVLFNWNILQLYSRVNAQNHGWPEGFLQNITVQYIVRMKLAFDHCIQNIISSTLWTFDLTVLLLLFVPPEGQVYIESFLKALFFWDDVQFRSCMLKRYRLQTEVNQRQVWEQQGVMFSKNMSLSGFQLFRINQTRVYRWHTEECSDSRESTIVSEQSSCLSWNQW